MPIKPENRALYPADWDAISARIRARAGNRCEQCKAPNGQQIARSGDVGAGTYMLEDGAVYDENDGTARGYARGSEYDAKRFVKIVLTTAHLDHDPRNNSDSNLRSLCCQCHNRYDRAMRSAHAAATVARRARAASLAKGQTELFCDADTLRPHADTATNVALAGKPDV